jgi:hypothetical protein
VKTVAISAYLYDGEDHADRGDRLLPARGEDALNHDITDDRAGTGESETIRYGLAG